MTFYRVLQFVTQEIDSKALFLFGLWHYWSGHLYTPNEALCGSSALWYHLKDIFDTWSNNTQLTYSHSVSNFNCKFKYFKHGQTHLEGLVLIYYQDQAGVQGHKQADLLAMTAPVAWAIMINIEDIMKIIWMYAYRRYKGRYKTEWSNMTGFGIKHGCSRRGIWGDESDMCKQWLAGMRGWGGTKYLWISPKCCDVSSEYKMTISISYETSCITGNVTLSFTYTERDNTLQVYEKTTSNFANHMLDKLKSTYDETSYLVFHLWGKEFSLVDDAGNHQQHTQGIMITYV